MARLVWLVLVGACATSEGLPVEAGGPPAFVLGGDAWLPPGGSFDLAVTGAPPGVFVGYAAAARTGLPAFCPAGLGCFDLAAPGNLIGVTAADAAGTASYSRAAPRNLRPYQISILQAAARAGGATMLSTTHVMTSVGRDVCVSNFSWPYALEGDGGDPGAALAPAGVHFDPAGGLVGGDVHGDPGDWSDGASVMTPAWGLPLGVGTITFAAPSGFVGLTIGAANGVPVEVEITGTSGGRPAFVSSTTVSRAVTMSFAGPIDRLDLAAVGGPGLAFVVDDLAWRDFGRGCP